MPANEGQNAVKAGAFVILTLALATTAVLLLAGVPEKLRPTMNYVVEFELSEGAAGLAQDSPVRIGGRDVGRVTGVSFSRTETGVVTGVLVDIAVSDDIELYEGATAFLERPLLGSGAVLNFESIGDQRSGETLPEGAVIPGEPQVPQFMAQAGYGSTQREQLQNILARADSLSVELEEAVAEVREVVGEARGRSSDWFERAEQILSTAQGAAEEMREGVQGGRRLIASLQESVDDNRPAVDQAIANIEAASASAREAVAHFNEETLALMDDMLERGRGAVAEAQQAVERLDEAVASELPDVRKAIANARLASDQLRLTTGEVRRAPWRLLYRPSERELEFELLYDAARSYADAVSDLRAASETLEAVGQSGTAEADATERYAREISEAFQRYETAEERFLELLSASTP